MFYRIIFEFIFSICHHNYTRVNIVYNFSCARNLKTLRVIGVTAHEIYIFKSTRAEHKTQTQTLCFSCEFGTLVWGSFLGWMEYLRMHLYDALSYQIQFHPRNKRHDEFTLKVSYWSFEPPYLLVETNSKCAANLLLRQYFKKCSCNSANIWRNDFNTPNQSKIFYQRKRNLRMK